MPAIVIPYCPRPQFQPYHDRTQRWACLVAHRRAGKTVANINDLVYRALTLDKPHGRYAYVAPYLGQGKEVAWEYLQRFSRPIAQDINIAELRVVLNNGASIRIHGADNPDRLRGSYLDGVVLDEFADFRPGVWGEVIRPMLADRAGWATFIGTPKGKNEFWERYEKAVVDPEWFTARLLASETGILPADELDAARKDMTPEQYAQEFECSFQAAITGAYFALEMAQAEQEGRITDVAYDDRLLVHTAWDLGIGDATSIWFWQVAGKEIRIIDWHEDHGRSLSHYADVLHSRGYRYGDDWVPHDARVRELGTGRTRVETLASLRRKPRLVPDHRVMDGINAARLTLDRVWFDADRCARGIEALKQYRADFDEKARTFRDAPRHDWTSHSADAFRYLCMAWRELVPEEKRDPLADLLRPKTLGEMLKEKFGDEEDEING